MRFFATTVFVLLTVTAAARAADPPATRTATRPTTAPVFPAGDARRIVLVCDISETMRDKVPALVEALLHSIGTYGERVSFNIILFQNGEYWALHYHNLVQANLVGGAKAYQFLHDIRTRHKSDPLPALRYAIRLRPDVIYLVTGADFLHPRAVASTARLAAATMDIKVNTVAWYNPDRDYQDALRQIARDGGGRFRRAGTGQEPAE